MRICLGMMMQLIVRLIVHTDEPNLEGSCTKGKIRGVSISNVTAKGQHQYTYLNRAKFLGKYINYQAWKDEYWTNGTDNQLPELMETIYFPCKAFPKGNRTDKNGTESALSTEWCSNGFVTCNASDQPPSGTCPEPEHPEFPRLP